MRLIKSFIQGIMNKDLDERLIPDGQYRDALNIEVSASEGAGVGALENIKGNTNASNQTFIGTAKTIGAIADEANNNIYWFVTDSDFDYVLKYSEVTTVTTTLLKDTKGTVLKFDANYLITGVNIIDDLLFWTDNLNPPRRLNVKKYYAPNIGPLFDSFYEDDISVIVKPPVNSPLITLTNSITLNQEDNLRYKFIQFACRYKYENDEYSAISPFSSTAFRPAIYSYDFGEGDFESMINTYNRVDVDYFINGSNPGTGWIPDPRITEIQLLFRDTASTNINVIDSFKIENIINDPLLSIDANGRFTNTFDNNKIYTVLPPDEITRLFDNVPLKAKAQELIGSRIAYGNYVQFYNIADSNGTPIDIDYQLEVLPLPLPTSIPLPTFRSDRDYEIGLVYLDDYSRMTTVLTSNVTNNTVHIPPTNSFTANDIRVSINNEAPAFANKYRIFIKQAKGDYYNIFPIYYFIDEVFRWFRINRSDIDKLKINDYIICKSAAGTATESISQYKILDIQSQPEDFLDNGESQAEGLYFKIKVDDSSLFNGSDVFNRSFSTVHWSKYPDGTNHPNSTRRDWIDKQPDASGFNRRRIPIVNIPVYYGNSTTHYKLDLIPFTSGANNFGDNETFSQWINDARYKIVIDGADTFHWDVFTDAGYQRCQGTENTPIDAVNGNEITNTNLTSPPQPTIFKIKFPLSSGYKIGDYWVVNVHCKNWKNIFDEFINWNLTDAPQQAAIIPGNDEWFTTPTGQTVSYPQTPAASNKFTIDRTISAGSRIRMQIKNVSGVQRTSGGVSPAGAGDNWQEWQEWTSPLEYVNIEEWFWESGAYRDFIHLDTDGNDLGFSRVFFRRGFGVRHTGNGKFNQLAQTTGDSTPPQQSNWSAYTARKTVWMGVRGTGAPHQGTIDKRGYIAVKFEIIQQTNTNVFETLPIENTADIYYELSDTFDIINGAHQGNISNQNLTNNNSAVVSLNTSTKIGATISDTENSMYNAYCFGNGVEGLRIRGDFNAPPLKYSPRTSSVIEDYKQQRVQEAITYSGIYRENTGINNLNEFNLSLANFKYLDKFFGSIQKLHARDTDLVTFQENKVSKILYGKNLLSDAVGGGTIASIPQVLGTQITFTGEYGISKNPESFATWGNDMYFTDSRRGAVMRLGNNGMFEISSLGMRDYFKDLFVSNGRTQKIGAIDPFKERYVLANNDTPVSPCIFKTAFGFKSYITGNSSTGSISVTSNTDWVVTWVGAWVTVNGQTSPYAGEDSEIITVDFGANGTGADRTVTIAFTACGVSYPFVITQSGKTNLIRKVMVLNNGVDSGLVSNQQYDFTSNTTGGDIVFDNITFTPRSLAVDNNFNSFEGVDSMPVSGDTVTLKAGLTGTSTIKPFNPNFGNSLRYLVSNVEYTEDDIKTLILLSTATVPAIVGSNYEGSFTFTRTTEKFLYLIYDYRNNITPPATLTSSASISGTVNSIVDYTNRRGNITIRCTPSGVNTFYVKWNNRIVGQAINVAVLTDITFFKNELLPGEVEVIAEGGGAFTAQAGATTLASFAIDTTDDTLTTVCTTPGSPSPDTRYHSGAPGLPAVGDVIYNELSGLNAYDGNNAFHRIGPAPTTDYAVIDTGGLVLSVGSCSSCTEVAVPVITQPPIELEIGDSLVLNIPVTNNPISWAIVTTCNAYELNGGTDGAVFTATDCTTGNTTRHTVNVYEIQEICTTTAPVLVSGTGTSALKGTCDVEVLPPGILLDTLNGTLSGSTMKSGVYSFNITATNCFGTSVSTPITITINPSTTHRRFNMDSASPETTSGLACAITPAYSIFYHDGAKEYPEVNDFIYNFCECEQRIFNGGYLWYVTDELTGVKNNVIRIDSVGQVVEKVVCP